MERSEPVEGQRRRHGASLIVFLAISAAVAAVGALATIPNVQGWYASAVKPGWTPPHAVFGPVWTVLYALIAVSAWLVWRVGPPSRQPAIVAYAVQLGLNLVWTTRSASQFGDAG